MHSKALLSVFFVYSISALAMDLQGDRCPLKVYVDSKGRILDSRFAGNYKVTQKTLLRDVSGGCKEAGPTSSVTIYPYKTVSSKALEHLRALIETKAPAGAKITIMPTSTSR